MVARQQILARWGKCPLFLLLFAGVLGWTDAVPAQEADPAVRRPISGALLEGAPPDPDAFLLARGVAEVLEQDYPRGLDDLRAIETQLQRVLERAIPATVGIQIGPAAGSGVIISRDGLVLTAGHVSGEPGREAMLIMPDGRRVRAKTLGLNRRIDSGLMQITEQGPWPCVEMADSNSIRPGEWVVATGHPGGFNSDRSPPVRLGRVLYANNEVICTDCTLVGGDSGGPLFNMQAEVIGIHSRIGRSVSSNFHVPIATYHDTWDRLAAGEAWGGRLPTDDHAQVRPYLGINLYGLGDGVLVKQVSPGTPAARAGIQVNDVILKFADVEVSTQEDLIEQLWATQPGQRVELELKRGDETLRVRVVVGGIGRPLPGSPDYEPRERRRRPRREQRQEREERERPERAEPQPESVEPDGAQPPSPRQDSQPEPRGGSADEAGPQEPSPALPDGEKAPDGKRAEAHQDGAAESSAAQRTKPQAVNSLEPLGVELDPVAVRGVVSRVRSGSAAQRSGLRAGDVVVAVDGSRAGSAAEVVRGFADAEGRDGMELVVLRNGRELTLTLRD